MSRFRTLCVTPEQDSCTAEHLLRCALGCSASFVRRLKRLPDGIFLNGARAYSVARVRAGDLLRIRLDDGPDAYRPRPMPLPLDILWEDENFLVLNKPAGLSVHQSLRDENELTVENALAAYLAPDENPHPVSRLDRGTTGAMTVAKSGYAHELLRRLLHTPDFYREYLAIATGEVAAARGSIELPIGFAPGSTYQRAVREDGAPSRTEYEALETRDGYTLLRLVPRTGRTHQLRVHMAATGHPLLGDWLYGARDARMERPALHSALLRLTHPLSGELLELFAPLSPDMAGFLAEHGFSCHAARKTKE